MQIHKLIVLYRDLVKWNKQLIVVFYCHLVKSNKQTDSTHPYGQISKPRDRQINKLTVRPVVTSTVVPQTCDR